MPGTTTLEAVHGRLRTVLDAVLDGVIVTTPEGVSANPAARRILGVPDGAQLPPGLLPQAGRFRVPVTALDGRELVLDGSAAEADGAVIVVFRDVTDEHRESELNRQTLHAIFEKLPTAIGLARRETREILAVNRAYRELVGRPESDIVGRRPPFPWWGSDRSDRSAEVGWAAGDRLERVYYRPDGTGRPVEVTVHEIGAPDSGYLLALIRDLTDERNLQQQLVQSGKLTAVGELAAGVAHEINNPLFAILGLTEFLLKDAEPGSKALERLELIQETGLEIKEIVRALLEFARENAEERHVVALEDVVRTTVDLVRRTNANKGVRIVERYDESGVLVHASPNQLKQIILNLFANARQAMPGGGTVTVDVHRNDESAVVVVADDGPGIPVELQGRIFEPFFTTRRTTGGTGLGLSVGFGIAEGHGGSLTVVSTPGEGAAFTLRLPLVEAEA